MDMEAINLLLGPAVLISALSFLTLFFGRVAVSNKLRADADRVVIEIGGLTNLNKFLLSPAVIIAVLTSFLKFGQHHWFYLILSWALIGVSALVGLSIFGDDQKLLKMVESSALGDSGLERIYVKAFKKIISIFSLIPATWPLFPVYLAVAIEVKAGDMLWTAVFSVQALTLMLLRFFIEVLKTKPEPLPAKITLSNGEILADVSLLQITANEVHFRKGGTLSILNKDSLSRIDLEESQKSKSQAS